MLLVAAPLLSTLPEVVLAAVVLVAVSGLVDVRGAIHAWRVERTDGLALLVTFLATMLIGVEIGIGILVSLVNLAILDERDATTVRVDGPLLPASGVVIRDTIDAVLARREPERIGTPMVIDLAGVPSTSGPGVDALVTSDHAFAATGARCGSSASGTGCWPHCGGPTSRFGSVIESDRSTTGSTRKKCPYNKRRSLHRPLFKLRLHRKVDHGDRHDRDPVAG